MFYDEIKVDANNKVEIISGRLRETYQNFTNENSASILSFPSCFKQLDLTKKGYFEEYSKSYFNGDFIEGQGSEELLRASQKYKIEGDYLDIGSGPTALFWCLPLAKFSYTITFSDVIVEALAVLKEFKEAKSYPDCYKQVLKYLNLPADDIDKIFESPCKYMVFDCFDKWPSFINENHYARISAYGALSICANEAVYKDSVSQVVKHLKSVWRNIHRGRLAATPRVSNC